MSSTDLTPPMPPVEVQIGILTHRVGKSERDLALLKDLVAQTSTENRVRAERQEKMMQDGFARLDAKVDRLSSPRAYISFALALAVALMGGVAAHAFGIHP